MKKNVIILLLMPFIIALACLTTISATFNLIDTDIIGIIWDYSANEAYKVSSNPYQLKAVGQNQKNYPVFDSSLVWEVRNASKEDNNEYARIVNSNQLLAISPGNVIVSVSNQKGTIHKQMNVLIYDNSAIVINPDLKSSGSNIDKNTYFGQYDLKDESKVEASIPLKINAYPTSLESNVKLSSISSNLEFDKDTSKIKIMGALDDNSLSFVSFSFDGEATNEVTYSFKVVKDGVNVYSYSDLLYCTNKSKAGEVAVLQTSFESLDNLESDKNSVCFGERIDNKWNFKNEIYRFKTTYSTSYIEQWNEFVKTDKKYSPIDDNVNVGLHVQKDFYGNGFSINMHNLTYPYDESKVNNVIVPRLNDDNLFRGPLPFFCLGNPNDTPLVTAYGQDNIGMYVDGDNITINDLNLRSCDRGDNLANLDYVGTTLETKGKNITIKNCLLSNGKTVVRSISSDLLLSNCLLSYARNFLLSVGSDEYLEIDENKMHSLINKNGTSNENIAVYCQKEGEADVLMTDFITGNTDSNFSSYLYSLQDALDYTNKDISSLYKGHVEVNDCYFYMSNIASIAMESMFNGPYLYSSIPSLIGGIFGSLQNETGKSLVPLEGKKCGGISYPVELIISGKTRFYDYKDINGMDLKGLINENISKIANGVLGGNSNINLTIDDIFPVKSLLFEKARDKGFMVSKNINVPIAFYGGGLNLSKVTYSMGAEIRKHIQNDITPGLLNKVLSLGASSANGGGLSNVRAMMKRCVLTTIGFNDFKFSLINGEDYLFKKNIDIKDLINNAK